MSRAKVLKSFDDCLDLDIRSLISVRDQGCWRLVRPSIFYFWWYNKGNKGHEHLFSRTLTWVAKPKQKPKTQQHIRIVARWTQLKHHVECVVRDCYWFIHWSSSFEFETSWAFHKYTQSIQAIIHGCVWLNEQQLGQYALQSNILIYFLWMEAEAIELCAFQLHRLWFVFFLYFNNRLIVLWTFCFRLKFEWNFNENHI